MINKTTIMIAGRSETGVDKLQGLVQGHPEFEVIVRRVDNGHSDPLHGVAAMPDVLLLDLSPLWEDELQALMQRLRPQRPPLIAVGTAGSPEMMRMAMQAGAQDFFTHPAPAEELLAALHRVAQKETVRQGSLTAIINAKGGSGASFVASSLANVMAADQPKRVALIDMDLQFGSLPVYLDLEPQTGLMEALNSVEHLDALALEGYMTKHASGLHLLASVSDQVAMPWTVPPSTVTRILELLATSYDYTLVDVPRQIDPLTTAVLQRADQVLIVMQQGLAHLNDTKRMLSVLKGALAIPNDRLHVIVNRYESKSPVTVDDIRGALQPGALSLVPNDFKRVAEAINVGTSLLDNGKNAAITKAFANLAVQLGGQPVGKKRGLLRGAFSQFLGR